MIKILERQSAASTRVPMAGPAVRLPLLQRGVVLFIALIVLVAMTMAGIAIMRSVDTGNLISGNVAFKQGTLQGGDWGVNAAVTYLLAQANTGQLNNNYPSGGYSAIASEPADWAADAAWVNSFTVGTDAIGNTVQYVINRLCDTPGAPSQVNCAKLQKTGGEAGNSQGFMGAQFTNQPMIFYRITTRVSGPRGSTSIIQFDVAIQHS